jgi:hypothetical protein
LNENVKSGLHTQFGQVLRLRSGRGVQIEGSGLFLQDQGSCSVFAALLPHSVVLRLLPTPVKVVNFANGFGFNLQ